MSGWFGSGQQQATAQPAIAGMRVQTAVLGRTIPWVFGTQRIAPNLIQYDDFVATPHTQQQGGKGGGGGATNTTYTYTAGIILGLCRGPIAAIGQIWDTSSSKSTPADLSLDVYLGTDTQTAHPNWTAKHAAKAMAYRGLAYLASPAFALGTGGDVGNHTVEVKTTSAISAALPDARIDTVLQAILTDPVDGVGLPSSKVGDLTQLGNFALSNGLWVSPAYTEQIPAQQAIERLAEIAQCGIVWSDGKLKFVPYSDVISSGYGATYNPGSPYIPELTADDFLAGNPPIKIRRASVSGAYNDHQITYKDRIGEYNDATVVSRDRAHIERYGIRTKTDSVPEIATASVAQALANWRRNRSVGVRAVYEFRLSVRWDVLEPMDIVALTYAPDKLVQQPVRIISIDEDEFGDLSVVAEDCPLGALYTITPAAQSPLGGGVDYNAVPPGNVNAPVIFEPPLSLTHGEPQIWVGVSGGPNWGGCEMWISTDNASYVYAADIPVRARHGTLTAALPAGALIDPTDVLSVSLVQSMTTLSPGTTQDALDKNTLCYVGGELLAYRDAMLTGPNAYNLGYLVRGLYGSPDQGHTIGSNFMRLDDAVLHYRYDPQWKGRTIYVKFVSRNIYGLARQNISAVPAYQYFVNGSALLASGDSGGGSNRLFNADFSLGELGWSPVYSNLATNITTGVNGAVPSIWNINGNVGKSTDSMYIHQVGYVSGGDVYSERQSDPIPIEAGARYIVQGLTGAHRCRVAVFAYWFDSTGAFLGHSYNGNTTDNDEAASGGNLISQWKTVYSLIDAPPGAATLRVALRKMGTKPGYADSWGFFSQILFGEVGSDVYGPVPWSAGIQGAVIGESLGGQITQANAVNYVELESFNIPRFVKGSGNIAEIVVHVPAANVPCKISVIGVGRTPSGGYVNLTDFPASMVGPYIPFDSIYSAAGQTAVLTYTRDVTVPGDMYYQVSTSDTTATGLSLQVQLFLR